MNRILLAGIAICSTLFLGSELNRAVAFPTTIFVGKDGVVKHLHTGFSGPATGRHYEIEIQRLNEKVNELLNEEALSGRE